MMRMLLKSFNSLNFNVPLTNDRFKALWITNTIDGSEDNLISDRIFALGNSHLKEFRDVLMKKENPISLKQPLRLITPPKDVERKDQEAVSFDEGLELFHCEGQILQNEEEEDDDSDDGKRPEDQDTAISKAVAIGEQNIIPPAATNDIPAPILLADLCEEDSDLHKDAVFREQQTTKLQKKE